MTAGMTSRIAALAGMLLGLFGCATGRLGDVPVVLAPENQAEIVVIRDDSLIGMVISYIVEVDEREVFALRNGQYTRIPVPPGDYILSVKCRGGTWIGGERESILARPRAGEPFHVRLSPAFRCARIEHIDPQTGERLLAGKDLLPFD